MNSDFQKQREQLGNVLAQERKIAAARRQRVREARRQQFAQLKETFVAEIRMVLAGRIGNTS